MVIGTMSICCVTKMILATDFLTCIDDTLEALQVSKLFQFADNTRIVCHEKFLHENCSYKVL